MVHAVLYLEGDRCLGVVCAQSEVSRAVRKKPAELQHHFVVAAAVLFVAAVVVVVVVVAAAVAMAKLSFLEIAVVLMILAVLVFHLDVLDPLAGIIFQLNIRIMKTH